MEKLLTFTAQILLIHVTWTLVAAYPNLATQTANQSTTGQRSNGVRFTSSLAVDGSRNTDGFAAPYCAQTLHLIQSWWKVQLNMPSHINEIRIWLRSDSWGAQEPSDYDIYLSDSGTCGTGTHCVRQNPINHEMTVTCAGVGQWVVICGYTNTDMTIILCEVEIYGCPKENYGDECMDQCGNCLDSSCSLANGSCPGHCRAKYWGVKCSEECPVKCSGPACRQSDGKCTGCVSGYWGVKCSEECPVKCSDLACRQSDGKCTGCVSGYWGDECSGKCPDKCNNSVCTQSDGTCSGCVSMYWGDKCSEECPVKCSDLACRQSDGKCSGCVSGYWGDMCSENCSDGCDEQGCKQFSGICFDCDDGLWGDNCSMNCPSGCNVSCAKDDGVCLGCKSGYWSNTCDTRCGECSQTSCVQNNGSCVSGCKAGYVFPKCVCSKNCVNEVCNESTRICTNGCKAGYFGLTCSEQCRSSNCLNDTCHRETGNCSDGCIDTYWGENCSKSCANCKNNTCDQNNGMCSHGCFNDSFWGTHCKPCPDKCAGTTCNQTTGQCIGCKPAYWTPNCTESCSSNCRDTLCNQQDSMCIKGCAMGYTGDTCMQETAPPGVDVTTVTTGVVVPLLLIASAAIVAIFVIRRRRANKDCDDENIDEFESIRSPHKETTPEAAMKKNEKAVYETTPEAAMKKNEKAVYGNVPSGSQLISKPGISVDSLGELIRQKQCNDSFKDEYEKFPTGLVHTHEDGKVDVNIPKNRFKSTFPYDHSRVVLDALPGQENSDYINCSNIDNLEGIKRYIAAQGPKQNTITDFWRMIWQMKCETVVMLTNLIEGAKVKCDCYWPEYGKKLASGNFILSLASEEVRSVYIIRKIVVNRDGCKSRTITQYHFTAWPDHGVADPIQLTKFHRYVKQYDTATSKPMVVHCSAGIGRTGTYIALDALLDYGRRHGQVDIPGYVVKMRYNRMNMIQTLNQYELLYQALYEEFMYPSSAIPRTSYLEEYPNLDNGKQANQTRINKEFGKLLTMKIEYEDSAYEEALLPKNCSKNRGGTTIALENYRPFLSTYVSGSTNYINAVIIPGSREGSMYLLTQIPLKNTVSDFWRMMFDQKSNVVVKLNDVPHGQAPVCIFPPIEEPFTVGALTVKRDTASSIADNVVEQTFTITQKNSDDIMTVKVLEVQNWVASKDLPPSSKILLNLNDRVSRWQDQTGIHPVTIMCLNGSKCSGLYCAVSKLMEELRTEQEVDVYQTVREIQHRCPQCLNSNGQYRFCYQTIRDHLNVDVDDVYANM